MRGLTQAEVDGLNPGIRRLVVWLRANGFDTCDSGDGQTHDHACDRSCGAIQASYDPADGSAVIDLTGVSDKDLPPVLVTFKEKINDKSS